MKNKSALIAGIIFVVMVAVIAIVNACGGTFVGTFWSLVPAFVAIVLALITKEAYSSLFVGVVLGGIMAAECSVEGTIDLVTSGALISSISGSAGIFLFLVLLGIVVALVNKSGASRAFGEWAKSHIKTKVGAMLATFALGVLIFIDDYFNCLTVGSVMAPVTDAKKISRVKLAYLIDATAAPICMIAPISSWAAAISNVNEGGIVLFVKAIPYNFYSILTLVFVVTIAILGYDYGKMADFEIKANNGDLSILDVSQTDAKQERKLEEEGPADPHKGKLFDLVIPIVLLIGLCIWALLKVGFASEKYTGTGFVEAFSCTDATVGLPLGALVALVIIILYLVIRGVLSFDDAMACVPQGFIAMVPAITILTLATALKTIVNDILLSSDFVKNAMGNAQGLQWALPAIVFVVACVIAFATGTSWGTFGILIPIVSGIFPETSSLYFVGISACLAGAVCGDHCSPISDTTIMSSAGAHCNHIDHVSTQLPYAITVAAISFICYIVAGICSNFGATWISIPVGVVLTIGFLIFMKKYVVKTEIVDFK